MVTLPVEGRLAGLRDPLGDSFTVVLGSKVMWRCSLPLLHQDPVGMCMRAAINWFDSSVHFLCSEPLPALIVCSPALCCLPLYPVSLLHRRLPIPPPPSLHTLAVGLPGTGGREREGDTGRSCTHGTCLPLTVRTFCRTLPGRGSRGLLISHSSRPSLHFTYSTISRHHLLSQPTASQPWLQSFLSTHMCLLWSLHYMQCMRLVSADGLAETELSHLLRS